MNLKIFIIILIYNIELKYKIRKLLNIIFDLLKTFYIFLIKINSLIFFYIFFNILDKNLVI